MSNHAIHARIEARNHRAQKCLHFAATARAREGSLLFILLFLRVLHIALHACLALARNVGDKRSEFNTAFRASSF